MIYGSVCSGIEAATVAWHPLGWRPAFYSEIEKFPSAVLAHHYGSNMPGDPHSRNATPNYGDITHFKEWPDHGKSSDRPIDLLVGGTPCQSFSIAGLRKGLADPRGNLMLTYLAIARRYKPRWLVWENVPGVLSSNGGRDFGTFLGGLGELGYGFAYRVLDAQFTRASGYRWAVPQRRRRVFIVGYFGDWRPAAAVFFDAESLRGDHPPRRKAGQGVAGTISARPSGGGGLGADFDLDGGLIANSGDASYCVSVNGQRSNDAETETLVATRDVAAALTRGAESAGKGGYAGRRQEDDDNLVALIPCVVRGSTPARMGQDAARRLCRWRVFQPKWAVRRLTPRECERLQGYEDDYTRIAWRGKTAEQCPDGPRYKACGNSMAVNCMRALGERIAMVEGMLK